MLAAFIFTVNQLLKKYFYIFFEKSLQVSKVIVLLHQQIKTQTK